MTQLAAGEGASGRRATAIAVAAASLLWACGAFAQTTPLSPDDEVVLALTAPRAVLAEAIIGYSRPEGVYLPLGELVRALDFAITVEPEQGRAGGWFIAEDRRFELDLARGMAVVQGRDVLIPAGGVLRGDGELFVRADVLESWFPLKLRANLPAAAVDVEPLEPLPFQARLELERRRTQLGRGVGGGLVLPLEPTPYALFTPPSIDLDIRALTGQDDRTEYDARLSGDLAFMAADLFLAGDGGDAFSNARLRLGRSDPDGMGRYGLTEFGLGDVFSPDMPNGMRSASGRGFYVTNAPFDSALTDRIDVRGELPLGWQAELYRNGILIGSQPSAIDGRYEFRDVPLVFGANTVRVVLYGPRGETREEVRQYRGGGETLDPGEFRFRLGAVQVDTPVFDVGDEGEDDPLSLFDPAEKGEVQAALLAEYGLGRRLALTGHLGVRPDPDRNTALAGLGFRTDLRGAAVRLDATVADDGSAALSGTMLTRLAGVNLALEHAEYAGGFLDDRRAFDNEPLDRFSALRADVLFELAGQELPVTLNLERREQTDGDTELRAGARTSALLGPVLASGGLRYERLSDSGENDDRFDGDLDFNAPLFDGLARLALDYELAPDQQLETVSATWDKIYDERLSTRLGIQHQLVDDQSTRLLAAVTRRFSFADLTLDGEYDTRDSEFLIGLRLSTSLFWNGRSYAATRPGFAAGGASAVRIYRDLDADGRRDPNEPPAVGVRVGPDGQSGAASDSRGLAVVRGLGENRPVNVAVDVGSIEDPFQQPDRLGFQVLPRPGRLHRSEIGLVQTAEVETTILFEGAAERAVGNVDLELVDAEGKVVETARSEFDGFVLFDKVRAGTYRIRLQPQQSARLGLAMAEQTVVVAPDKDVIRGPQLRVRRGAPASAVAATGQTLVFREAKLNGATLVSPEALAPIWEPYKGSSVTLDELRVIAAAIEGGYAKAGYPFVAVVVPPQDVKDGVVQFDVIEGRISDLTIVGLDPVARRQADTAFSALLDRPGLPLSAVEAAYENASAVPGLFVAGSLRRGSEPGGMDLVVQARRKTWRTYLNLNNLYPDPTGPWGGVLGAEYNGASRYGDQTVLQLYTTFDSREQSVARLSHYRRLTGRGTAVSLSAAFGEAEPGEALSVLDIATEVQAYRAEIEHPLILRPNYSLSSYAALDWTDQETLVFAGSNQPFRIAEDKLRVASARLVGALGDADQLRGSVELRHGLDIGGASQKGQLDLSRPDADPQFWSVRASLSGEAPVVRLVDLAVRLEGQYSEDSLPAGEEFTIGNLTLGRGYEPGASYADRALGAVVEARFGPFNLRRNVAARPFVFYDGAQVWNEEAGGGAVAPDNRWVSSTGVGFRMEVKELARFDIVYAIPLGDPLGFGESEPQPRLLINMTTDLNQLAGSLRNGFGAIRSRMRTAGEAPR